MAPVAITRKKDATVIFLSAFYNLHLDFFKHFTLESSKVVKMEEEHELLGRFSPDELDQMSEEKLKYLLMKNDLDTAGDKKVLLERFKSYLENLPLGENFPGEVQTIIDDKKLESAVQNQDGTEAKVKSRSTLKFKLMQKWFINH